MPGPGRHREDEGHGPHEQGPLVDLRRHERGERGAGGEPPGEERRHEQLGRLRGEGRQPLHEEERAHAQLPAGLHERARERVGAVEDDAGREGEHRRGHDPSRTTGSSPSGARVRPVGFLRGRRLMRARYATKIPTSTRVDEVQRAAERQRQGVERAAPRKPDLHAWRRSSLRWSRPAPRARPPRGPSHLPRVSSTTRGQPTP